jgi:selenocysteine-specific elongation factor
VDLVQFTLDRNLDAASRTRLAADARLVVICSREGIRRVFLRRRWLALRGRMVDCIDSWHRERPLDWGPTEVELAVGIGVKPSDGGFRACVEALVAEARLRRERSWLHRPDHRPVIAPADSQAWRGIELSLRSAGLRPPSTSQLASAIGAPPEEVHALLRRFASIGRVIEVGEDRFLLPNAADELAEAARTLARRCEGGRFTAAEFRDFTGIGRKLSIRVLEHFDRRGITRRAGELRFVVPTLGAPASPPEIRTLESCVTKDCHAQDRSLRC